jgi:hypothetical protein
VFVGMLTPSRHLISPLVCPKVRVSPIILIIDGVLWMCSSVSESLLSAYDLREFFKKNVICKKFSEFTFSLGGRRYKWSSKQQTMKPWCSLYYGYDTKISILTLKTG